ncbi:dolichol kinase [Halococcus dombrowskii]|uniref:Dolichol kinase n=1 Tax=Halococcus dombrowskii TaxID=179637 RepID=A0AAV3SL83_HALDO|nr:dolichol kinase [Halococcus dombrowskii]UOO95581.1 dolichol kinase [Halococcus dombrowskii]
MGELKRRAVHASGTALPAAYLLDLISYEQFRWLLVAGSVVVCCLEALRLFVGLDWRLYDELTREYEQDNLAGYALYTFSGTAVALVFQPAIAIPAILMLTIADPLSGLLGSGELQSMKELSVIAVTFAVCFLIAFPFVALVPAVCGAFAATLADGVKPVVRGYVVDDNLTIPIAAAVAITIGLRLTAHGLPFASG